MRNVAGIALLLAGAGCGAAPEPAPPAGTDRPNVMVVLVDALRADRLGPYGFRERPTSPNLDRFAAQSVVFERAISQDGWTVPSVASLFSGVYPQTHGVLRFIDPKSHFEGGGEGGGPVLMDAMSQDHTTLAERFAAAGYATAAILKSDVINAGRGFEQGFEHFEFLSQPPKDRLDSGAQLTDATLRWLATHGGDPRPFFLYLHYMDPHTSYIAPEPYYSRYSTGFSSSLDGNHGPIVAFNEEGSPEPTADDIGKLLALYDAEIEYWDSQFGRLVDHLAASGLLNGTIVVVTADHGEAFWEHELFEHRAVFQENIWVPMIFRVPGVAPARISSLVQMIDIGPTVVELAGVEPGPHWVGLSHAEAIRSGSPVLEQPVSSEWAGERTLITPDGLKILLGHGEPRLYDLTADPGETVNLAERRPEDFARLKDLLELRFREAVELKGRFAAAGPTELTPEQVEDLRALGYLDE
jgi:arylsulfatase A-like enzyme